MKSLLDEIKKELVKYAEEGIIDVIDNREKSAKYVKKLIEEDMDLPCDKITIKSLKNNFGDRINHILFTFSMGLLLARFKGLDKLIEREYKKYFKEEKNIFFKTWLIISLYHDYGYFLLGDANYENVKSLNDLNVKNSIFEYKSEENEAMFFFNLDYIEQEKSRYSKELFSNYFEWRIQECSGEEKFEHGIAGGYVLFDDILKNNFNSNVQNRKKNKTAMNIESNRIKTDLFYQNICYRIMEHNIWTIDPNLVYKSSFKLIKLKEVFKENFKKITKAEPLLYLLSLVDTIEFIKRMSTTSLDDPNSQSRPTTLSKKILIEIEENHIYIDTNLTSNTSGYKAWYDGIISLNEWTDVLIKADNGIIKIK